MSSETSAFALQSRVYFPIDRCDWFEGTLVAFDETRGTVVVVDDEGVRWSGYEYQLEPAHSRSAQS